MNTCLLLALIPLLPLVGSALAYVLGRPNPSRAGVIATLASALSFLCVLLLVRTLPHGTAYECTFFEWIPLEQLTVGFTFRFDQLTGVMGMVVTGIGTLIHLYSTKYMTEDPSRHRFFSYLNLFLFSMLLLVLGGNLLVLFVGWEGVGLCSYLLIGFWFKNLSYAGAGRKAFVVNRIGDAGFLLGTFLVLQHFGSLDFLVLKEAVLNAGNSLTGGELEFVATLITLSFFVGATGKSAQLPLFVWLPDAMAGPTPVSALIHAATMVTAGVYLVARMHFLFALAPLTMAIMLGIALLTAFVAATIALTQTDIKKVLAYSTVSQLGFMFMAASVGAYWVAVFHLVTHAFFKACLFLGAGSVIHGCHHEQDMREMGGLLKKMPITAITYCISTLAIAGIFPFAGYQSKHAILAALGEVDNPYLVQFAHSAVMIASFTAFLTAFYMTRSVAMTFLGTYRGHAHPHESPWAMTVPLVVLAALALGGGLWLEHSLPHYLSEVLPVPAHHESEGIVAALIHSWVGFLGIALALLFYTRALSIPRGLYRACPPLSRLLTHKWYLDELYRAVIIRPLERTAYVLWRGVDQAIIDGAVNGTAQLLSVNGEVLRGMQSGQIRHYALFMFFSLVVIIVFYLAL